MTRGFNLTAYNEYSALYLPGPYAVVYLLAFALATCLLVHTILYHGKSLINGIKRVEVEQDDIHAKLMRRYPEVPDSWYGTMCVVFFVLGIVAVEVYPTRMPVWALAMSVLLPALYMLPCGFIYAVTGQGLAINLLAEILPGALLAGQPLPNMVNTFPHEDDLFSSFCCSRSSKRIQCKPLEPPLPSFRTLSLVTT